MRCDEFVDRLTAFDVGALTGAPAADARSHLASCGTCRMAAAAERQLVREVRTVAEPAPDDLHRAVQAALRHAAHPGPARRWRRALVAVVVLSTLAGLGAVLAERAMAPAVRGPVSRATAASARPATSFDGAWAAFAAPRLPLEGWDQLDGDQKNLLVSSPAYDLLALRLDLEAEGGIHLARRAAVAAEYRDGRERIVLFRWPLPAQGAPGGGTGGPVAPGPLGTRTTPWGRALGVWWRHDDVVLCAIGSFPSPRFQQIISRMQDVTPPGP